MMKDGDTILVEGRYSGLGVLSRHARKPFRFICYTFNTRRIEH